MRAFLRLAALATCLTVASLGLTGCSTNDGADGKMAGGSMQGGKMQDGSTGSMGAAMEKNQMDGAMEKGKMEPPSK